jgi:aminoglycoside phosphotransferase (APT) family kinase protein
MTQPQWVAEIVVDAALAASLVARAAPFLGGASIEAFGNGWDNTAFLAGGTFLFRFPRRTVASRLLEREVACLSRIAQAVPLPIPIPEIVGAPDADFPWSFYGYRLLVGQTLCAAVPDDRARGALAQPLGEFLRALHAIDPQPFVARGLPPDEINRLEPERRTRQARERYTALSAAGTVPAKFGELVEWLEAHPPVTAPPDALRIVHGDLYARHVLVDSSGAAAGVIDWGDIHFGDPALDLAVAHLVLPLDAHADFIAAYGPLDARTWNTARFRAIYHALLELEYGNAVGDAALIGAGQTALRFLQAGDQA